MSYYKPGRDAKEAYEKFRRGDPIDNDVLLGAAAYWQDVAVKLLPLGDTFRLASVEANRVAIALEDFVSARKLTPTANSS